MKNINNSKTDNIIIDTLIKLYQERIDLQNEFPEVLKGKYGNYLKWVNTSGITIDSCRKKILPWKDTLMKLEDDYNKGLISIEKISLKSVWDESKEQYKKNDFNIYWECNNTIAHYQYETVTGDKNISIVEYTINYIKDNLRSSNLTACFIGCDEIGRPEIKFNNTGLFKEIFVFDISEELLKRQRIKCQNEYIPNINYIKADLNNYIFKNKFDVVYAWGTVHHIENLEHFFNQIDNAMSDRGLFFMREYVGAKYFQFPQSQIDLINALIQIIPSRYLKLLSGDIKNDIKRIDAEDLKKIDPTESVRSDEIIPILKKYMKIIQHSKTGGTILNPLLSGIVGNFEKDPKGQMLLETLISIEKELISTSLIDSDYVYIIAKKMSNCSSIR